MREYRNVCRVGQFSPPFVPPPFSPHWGWEILAPPRFSPGLSLRALPFGKLPPLGVQGYISPPLGPRRIFGPPLGGLPPPWFPCPLAFFKGAFPGTQFLPPPLGGTLSLLTPLWPPPKINLTKMVSPPDPPSSKGPLTLFPRIRT